MTKLPLDVVFAGRSPTKHKAPRYRETIYVAVKEAILSGKLLPNQPIVEEQLAASLQVSRTPVREALVLLQHEGYIGPRDGRRLYVCEVSQSEFIDMFIANETVEPYLARRAARLATAEQLAAIGAAIQLAATYAEQNDAAGFLHSSREFHRLLGEAAANRTLADFVMRNEERTDMHLLGYGKVLGPQHMTASVQEHRAILDALQTRDPEAAARLVIYHAQSLRARFADLFSRTSPDEKPDEEEA